MSTGDAQDWIVHATADLHYAKLGHGDPKVLEGLVAFHAQQAVEKALKALLVKHQVDFPKTHDLEELVALAEDAGLVLPPEVEKAKELTAFAVQSRYPGFDDPITQAEVAEAIAVAEKIVEWASREVEDRPEGSV